MSHAMMKNCFVSSFGQKIVQNLEKYRNGGFSLFNIKFTPITTWVGLVNLKLISIWQSHLIFSFCCDFFSIFSVVEKFWKITCCTAALPASSFAVGIGLISQPNYVNQSSHYHCHHWWLPIHQLYSKKGRFSHEWKQRKGRKKMNLSYLSICKGSFQLQGKESANTENRLFTEVWKRETGSKSSIESASRSWCGRPFDATFLCKFCVLHLKYTFFEEQWNKWSKMK